MGDISDALKGKFIVRDGTTYEIVATEQSFDCSGDKRSSVLAQRNGQFFNFYWDDFHDGVFEIYTAVTGAEEACRQYAEEAAATEAAE